MTSPDPTRPYPAGMLDGYGGIEAWANKRRVDYEADTLAVLTESTGKLQEFGENYRDGQLDLNGRLDLLEGVQGYGAAYMTKNPAVVSGATRMPFTGQFGPLKGVRILAGGGLLLESKGLWQISATTLAKSTVFGGGDETVMYLSVRYPGGAIFSEVPDVKRPGGARLTHHMTAPFVIPDPNFEVQVWVTSAKWRNFAGGTLYSRLSAIKHDNRVVATGTPDYPDEPIE